MRRILMTAIILTFLAALDISGAQEDPIIAQLIPLGQNQMDMMTASESNVAKKISLDLRSIDIVDALKFLALKADWNIIVTNKVTGRVTLNVEEASLDDVFNIMLRSNELAYVKEGDIYNVMTEKEYKAIYGRKFGDVREVRVFRLKYAIPEQAFTMIDTLKSDIGRILVDPESGTVLIMDTPENIREVMKALQSLEQKSCTEVFMLRYAKAEDVAEKLKTQLDAKKVGMVKADPRANQVIVQTLPERMDDIRQLITDLDKKTKQVLVSVKIIQIRLLDDNTRGIEWEGIFNILSNSSAMTYLGSTPFTAVQATTAAWRSRKSVLETVGYPGSYPFSGFTTDYVGEPKATGTEKMHLGMVGDKADFDAVVKYLETIGKVKVLTNPSLAIINNEEAKVHIGERQAYITTTTTRSASTITTAEAVTYLDVGVQMKITPNINDKGYVTMRIKPEISSVVDHITSPSGNEIPIVDTSMAETTVMVKDGATIIIGGLSKQESIDNAKQTPGLGDIPVVGNLFKSGTKKLRRLELVILLTPVIIEGDELITIKDSERKRFPPKKAKKFDVFKEEKRSEPIEKRKPVEVSKDGSLEPKGFKKYE